MKTLPASLILLMKQIDEVIALHSGWPFGGAQGRLANPIGQDG